MLSELGYHLFYIKKMKHYKNKESLQISFDQNNSYKKGTYITGPVQSPTKLQLSLSVTVTMHKISKKRIHFWRNEKKERERREKKGINEILLNIRQIWQAVHRVLPVMLWSWDWVLGTQMFMICRSLYCNRQELPTVPLLAMVLLGNSGQRLNYIPHEWPFSGESIDTFVR